MSRTAIIGTCVTRDIWRELEIPLDEVLYISRTSLASLTSAPIRGVTVPSDPPPIDGIGRHSLRMVAADLEKTALIDLAAFKPTHLIIDLIDERFDLLRQGESIATHTWELACLDLIGKPGLESTQILPRMSDEVDALWRQAVTQIGALLDSPPFADVRVILHHTRWADTYVDRDGQRHDFGDAQGIMPGVPASKAAHNDLLRRYRDLFMQAVPRTRVVQASSRLMVGDAGHIWGLSPFHYVRPYYDDVWRQLRGLGV